MSRSAKAERAVLLAMSQAGDAALSMAGATTKGTENIKSRRF